MPECAFDKIKIAVVNLMPNQRQTELQWKKLLTDGQDNVELDFVRMETHKSRGRHVNSNRSYLTLRDIKDKNYHGMIITGAPVEKLDFSQVDYWEEFQSLLDYGKYHVASTICICWAAQAALYCRYGINKEVYGKKVFGVYKNRILEKNLLTKGIENSLLIPQSRYAGNNLSEIKEEKSLLAFALSIESGSYVLEDKENKSIYISGHPEYARDSIHKEYIRDCKKGLNVQIPYHYYKDNQPGQRLSCNWKRDSQIFFHNWLESCRKNGIKEKTFELVSKFGGTSLADAKQFEKVKKIIQQEECKSVIVSAPGKRNDSDDKITDLLCKCYEANETKCHIIEIIRERFITLCQLLKLKEEIEKRVEEVMEEILYSNDRDYVISRGEYLNGIIMAEYLGYSFVDAREVIFFDEEGKPDEIKTYHAIYHRLTKIKRVVIPGFYGSSFQGGIKTFARGGSDITGSLIARGLGADLYQNWSDVDGVMTADPKTNKGARLINQMTYDELLMMAEGGANIYHPDAVSYVREAGIPLRIKNTNRPELEGTLIRGEGGSKLGREKN